MRNPGGTKWRESTPAAVQEKVRGSDGQTGGKAGKNPSAQTRKIKEVGAVHARKLPVTASDKSCSGARTDAQSLGYPPIKEEIKRENRYPGGEVSSARPSAGKVYYSAVTTKFSHFLYASR